MKTSFTFELDRSLVHAAERVATAQGISLCDLLARQLECLVREEIGYRAASERARGRLASGLDLGWTPPASRDELHER